MEFLPIWERVVAETDLKKMIQLAEFLGITQQFVSKKKREDDFPIEWAFKVAQAYGLSTDWLMTGNGPKGRNQSTGSSQLKNDFLKEVDQWLSHLLVKDRRNNEWFEISFERCFPMFLEWKKGRDGEEGDSGEIPRNNIV